MIMIDFYAIVKALKDVHYSGWFTLEADRYLKDYTADNLLTGVQELASSAKKLLQMWEEA